MGLLHCLLTMLKEVALVEHSRNLAQTILV